MQEKQDAGVYSPGLEDPLEEENDNPYQHSCLKNPMDRVAWWAADKGHKGSDMSEQLLLLPLLLSRFSRVQLCATP